MKFYIALTAILFSGCGTQPFAPQPLRDTGQFEAYVQTFEMAGGLRVDRIKIELAVPNDPHERGACEYNPANPYILPTIQINPNIWPKLSEDERELLIFHELGHCVLNRDHVTSGSIMTPYALPVSYYVENREELWADLFNGR
jgi:hypothetical protein